MEVKRWIYEDLYEIVFFDKEYGVQLSISLSEDDSYWMYINHKGEVCHGELPKEIDDMFRNKYKLPKKEIKLPPLEEVEELPWE